MTSDAERPMPDSKTPAFIDTNVLLHYPPLSDTDWCTLLDVRGVRLVICMRVVHELDDAKSDSRLGGRASRAIKEIQRISAAGGIVREGVDLALFTEEVRRDELAPGYIPESGDDLILHLVQRWQRSNPVPAPVVVSEDLGMQLRCGVHGVRWIAPLEASRLENPGDDLSRKLKQLETQLLAIKTAAPDLSVVAQSADPQADASTEIQILAKPDLRTDFAAEMEEVQEHVPLLDPPDSGRYGLSSFGAFDSPLERREYADYNRAVEEFYADYQHFQEVRGDWVELHSRMIRLRIVIRNSGGAPAQDVLVRIVFPEFIAAVAMEGASDEDLRDPTGLIAMPPIPQPPERPSHLGVRMPPFTPLSEQLREIAEQNAPPPNLSADLSADSRQLTVRVGKLNHHNEIVAGVLRVLFAEGTVPHTFDATCVTTAGNVSQRLESRVLVRVSAAT